jgi:hypothetical protein
MMMPHEFLVQEALALVSAKAFYLGPIIQALGLIGLQDVSLYAEKSVWWRFSYSVLVTSNPKS